GSTVVTSPDATVTDGQCYVYTLTGTDNVANAVSVTSNPVLVDANSSVGSLGSTATISSLTWSHTVANKAMRMLGVGVQAELAASNACQASTVTYGGVPLTKISQGVTAAASYQCASLWYLSAPAVGTANVVVTFPAAMDGGSGGSISLWNVKQGAPDAFNSNVNEAGAASTSVTTLAANSTVIDMFGSGQAIGDLTAA